MTEPCPNCGTLNEPGHRFCSNCGAALKTTSTSETASGGAATRDFSVPGSQGASSENSSYPAYVVKRDPAEVSSETSNSAPTLPISLQNPQQPNQTPSQPPYVIPQPPVSGNGQNVPTPPQSTYQVYTPQNGARKDGAAYVPYSANASTSVEKSKQPRSWLVPVIVGAAVILFGLAVLSGYMLVGKNGGTTNGSVPPAPATGQNGVDNNPAPTPTALPASASDEDQVKQAIEVSNLNQIKSWENLDVDILKQSYTGQALDDNTQQVQDLKSRNMYAIPVNQSLKIMSVKVNGNTATATTIEKWSVTYYGEADKKPLASNAYTLDETYHLVKQNGKWFVEKLEISEDKGTPSAGA